MKDSRFKAVIEAAYKIVEKYNFEGANVSRIVRLAKVSGGVIYRNFGTKDNFFKFLYYEALGEYMEFIDINKFNSEDVPGRLAIITAAIYEFAKCCPEKCAYIEKYREVNLKSLKKEDITRDFLKDLREDVRVWIEEGKIVQMPVNSVYAILSGSMIKLAIYSEEEATLESDEVANIANNIVSGLMANNKNKFRDRMN